MEEIAVSSACFTSSYLQQNLKFTKIIHKVKTMYYTIQKSCRFKNREGIIYLQCNLQFIKSIGKHYKV